MVWCNHFFIVVTSELLVSVYKTTVLSAYYNNTPSKSDINKIFIYKVKSKCPKTVPVVIRFLLPKDYLRYHLFQHTIAYNPVICYKRMSSKLLNISCIIFKQICLNNCIKYFF